MKTWSLKRRIALISMLVLLLAFSAIYFITKTAYTNASLSRVQESLQSQIYALMAVAEDRDAQLTLPDMLRNDRLNHLNSGLVAYVLDIDGDLIWRSRSSDNFSFLPDITLKYSLNKVTQSELDGRMMFWIGDRIIWEHENEMEGEYLFLIGEKQSILGASVRQFKREVAISLSITAIVLLLVLVMALNISLNPLKHAQRQIELVERGEIDKVDGKFPDELKPLTSSINQLLDSEKRQKARYRDSLGNLAHSLKTPLAVLRSELQARSQSEFKQQIEKQIGRIDDIVRYQLNRSVVTAGKASRTIVLSMEIAKIVDALKKVHADKKLKITTQVDPGASFPGGEGDLLELVGNLADNACKWAKTEVLISARKDEAELVLSISDDGPGVPPEKRELILDRGKRLDQQAEGQGLGLSIVMDIVKLYRGEMTIDKSELGGSLFRLRIPY